MATTLQPILDWLDHQIEYVKGRDAVARKNAYRLEHAEECVLSGGEDAADMIFSAWLPLKFTFYKLQPGVKGEDLQAQTPEDFENLKARVMTLPEDDPTVQELVEFFKVYYTKENVMVLPAKRAALDRSIRPFCDYMPSFLRAGFTGNSFTEYFDQSDEVFVNWVKDQRLEVFFKDGEVSRENILGMEFKETMQRFDGYEEDFEKLAEAIHWYRDILAARKELLEA